MLYPGVTRIRSLNQIIWPSLKSTRSSKIFAHQISFFVGEETLHGTVIIPITYLNKKLYRNIRDKFKQVWGIPMCCSLLSETAANPFTFSKPRNPSIDVSDLRRIAYQ